MSHDRIIVVILFILIKITKLIMSLDRVSIVILFILIKITKLTYSKLSELLEIILVRYNFDCF